LRPFQLPFFGISFLRVLGAVPFLLPVFPVFLFLWFAISGPGAFKVQRFKVQRFKVQGSTVQGSTVQGSTVQGSTVQGSTVQGSTVQASTVQGSKAPCLPIFPVQRV